MLSEWCREAPDRSENGTVEREHVVFNSNGQGKHAFTDRDQFVASWLAIEEPCIEVALGAFERYYSDSIVMQEGNSVPREGKEANREYEQQYFGSIAEFHGVELHGDSASDDRSYSEWTFDLTLKDGTRLTNTQVAVRKWRDGQVIWERFYVAS